MMMNSPFASAVVCCNENLKTLTKPWDKQNPLMWYFMCAGISGGVAGLLTNPLDVIKTRLQTQHVKPTCNRLLGFYKNDPIQEGCPPESECKFSMKKLRYRDILSTAKFIYQTEGLASFSKGMMPRLLINVPSTALSWGTYEVVKLMLGVQRD